MYKFSFVVKNLFDDFILILFLKLYILVFNCLRSDGVCLLVNKQVYILTYFDNVCVLCDVPSAPYAAKKAGDAKWYKKAVLSQGNRAMQRVSAHTRRKDITFQTL